MSEMIDRIAAIIGAEDSDPLRPEYRRRARRIIEAMREPTQAMIDAGYGAACEEENGAMQSPNYPEIASATWAAMIAAALK